MKKLSTILRLRPHLRRIIFVGAVMVMSAGGAFTAFAFNSPLEIIVSPEKQRVDQPVELTFSKRIDEINFDQIKISPEVQGRWKHEAGSITTDDELVFHPSGPFVVDTTYTVMLPTLSMKFGSDLRPEPIAFTTENAPGLSDEVGLAALTDGSTIAADQMLTVELTSQNRGLRELELRSKPDLKPKLQLRNDKTYSWQIKNHLPQGKKITLEVFDSKNQTSLLKRTFKVAPEPQVKTPVKAVYFGKNDVATIAFNEAIEPASQKYISFSLPGNGIWRDKKTYVFTPESVEPGKTYDYTIKKGLRSQQGGIVSKNRQYSFRTIGAVSATASPYGAELSQARQLIRFNFDQPVDHRSVEGRFSVSSGKVVGTSWSGNTFLAEVKSLGYQRTVTATVGAGVANQGFGLPSARAFSAQFTTEVRSKRLNVPYYAQQQSSTCTAAALRMALGYRGIGASEMGLVHKMGYKPREMNRDKKPHVWDDPSEMFVGYADGGSIFKGAGPDAPPVAKAAQASGRSASAVRGVSVQWIAEQTYAGNPVILFGATQNAGYETWKTSTGKTVRMNVASHVVVITGVKGESHSPLGFWVNDPLYGAYYWTAGQVQANIARDVHRQAVVVY